MSATDKAGSSAALPFSPGGWITAFAATAVSGLPNARRALREKLATDAGDKAAPGYTCATYVGWDEIQAVAAEIRRQRPVMETDAFDTLEYALSEAASCSTDDDPPVLLLGVQPVTGDPVRRRRYYEEVDCAGG